MGTSNRSYHGLVQRQIRIGLAQVDTVVGDLEGNTRLITDWIGRARDQGVDIVAFPELAITGYPPEDLVLKPGFVRDNLKHLQIVAGATKGISAVVGFVDEDGDLYNAAAFMHDGEIKAVYHKVFLPNYGVFDEQRDFRPARRGAGARTVLPRGPVDVRPGPDHHRIPPAAREDPLRGRGRGAAGARSDRGAAGRACGKDQAEDRHPDRDPARGCGRNLCGGGAWYGRLHPQAAVPESRGRDVRRC